MFDILTLDVIINMFFTFVAGVDTMVELAFVVGLLLGGAIVYVQHHNIRSRVKKAETEIERIKDLF